ncbi:MAG: TraM recognition domain-containing protein [Acidimicrobiales bacterium]
MVLDEGTNYPLPSLPSLISEGGGSGITTLAVLQFLAQARDRWGREAAQAIWDSGPPWDRWRLRRLGFRPSACVAQDS